MYRNLAIAAFGRPASAPVGIVIISGKAFLEVQIAGSWLEECQGEHTCCLNVLQYQQNKPFPQPHVSSVDGLCRHVAKA
jgi:hypothetical protein